MNWFEGYPNDVSFFFDHRVQTSVMNVDCTRKGILFLLLAFAFFSHFLTTGYIFSITHSHSIVVNIRSHRMCTVCACVCLFNHHLSSLLFSFSRDLFFYDVIVVEYNNEQSIMGVKKREKQNRYNTTPINDAKMTRIMLFFFSLIWFFIKPILLTPIHSSLW
jgi:hypothetical protein